MEPITSYKEIYHTMNRKILFLSLIALPFCFNIGTVVANQPIIDQQATYFADITDGILKTTEQTYYLVTLYKTATPIPLKKIHSWALRIENKNGELVEGAKILVSGGMPMHHHGFPTQPHVREHREKGFYSVDGVKFSMPGSWEQSIPL